MGWGTIDEAAAKRTLACSTYTACLRQEGRLLGLARVVGDGVLYFYISDVIVNPSLQGGGCGSTLMAAVMAYPRRAADPGATIAILPLRGRERSTRGSASSPAPTRSSARACISATLDERGAAPGTRRPGEWIVPGKGENPIEWPPDLQIQNLPR
jgi:hypothetical protein